MSVHIESPLVIRSAAKENSPSATLGNVEVVSLESVRIPERPGFDRESAFGCHIGISACQNDRHEVASVIVEITLVIRANPMMDSNRKAEKDEGPTIEIRALRLT